MPKTRPKPGPAPRRARRSAVQRAVVVRRGSASDLADLVALELRCFDGDRMSARQYRHHLASPTAWVGVARDPDGLLGSAVLFFRRDSDRARLYSIAVDRAARGRGLGAALLRAAEREAQRRGCRRAGLEVRQDNAGAIALYERLGYGRIGTRPDYYEDGAPAYRYEKHLKSQS